MEEKLSNFIFYSFIFICLLISLFICLITPVSASSELYTQDVTTGIMNTSNCGSVSNNSYCFGQGYNSITWSKATFGGSYYYAVEYLQFNLQYLNFTYSSPTTIEIYNALGTFTNNSYSCSFSGSNAPSSCSVNRVSNSKLNINFKTGLSNPQYLTIYIGGGLGVAEGLDGVNINKVMLLQTINDPNNSVIENQNNNTQNIIDNSNQNTEDIIENQNQNSIDEQMSANNNSRQEISNNCKNFYAVEISKGKRIETNGTLIDDDSSYYTIDYFAIDKIAAIGSSPNRIYLINPSSSSAGYNFYFYDTNKNLLDYNRTATRSLVIPSGAVWFRFSSTSPATMVYRGSSSCIKVEDEIKDAITSDNIDNGLGSSFFDDFDESDPGGISSIVTKPLVIINSLLSNNNSCQDLVLPSFLGVTETVSLPSGCILWNNAPTSVITLWNIFVCGVCSYVIIIDLFKLIENLKTPTHNKIEVLDL